MVSSDGLNRARLSGSVDVVMATDVTPLTRLKPAANCANRSSR
jgi:hypothetical protein